MIPELGHFCLILALGLTFIPIFGLFHTQLSLATRGLIVGQAFFINLSILALIYAFVQDDFTVQYVAQHSNSALPIGYKIAALWGAHEGSVLLWVWILSGWSLLVACTSRVLPAQFSVRFLAVLSALQMGFLIFLLHLSNPFLRNWSPLIDGQGLNPLLQDIGLILHPPILYTGLIGFAVPFAFSMALLSMSATQGALCAWLQPYVRAAWCFLTLGIILGSWWAYYELGWGGWWFWDPVENASFMPWLMGTAVLHTFRLLEKNPRFIPWFLCISMVTFLLSLLGTFLVRSGILSSVHAFAVDPERGHYMLIFLGITLAVTLSWTAYRMPHWSVSIPKKRLAWDSISGLLLIQNGLFSVLCASVLLGTLFPIIYEIFTGQKISVGFPYFNQVFVPLSIPLFFLMGIVGLKAGKTRHNIAWVEFIISVLIGLWVCFVFPPINPAYTAKIQVCLGIFISVWLLLTTLKALIPFQRRYLAMVVAHVGVSLCILGVTLNTQYSLERELKMKPGDSLVLANNQVSFDRLDFLEGPNYLTYRAQFFVNNHLITPEKRLFTAQFTPMTETAMDISPWRDIYIALGEKLDAQYWSARVHYKPFVRWIWGGGLLMVLGGILAFGSRRSGVKLCA
jgi:cytochrome c-type biogenesis protein CcmF